MAKMSVCLLFNGILTEPGIANDNRGIQKENGNREIR